MDILWNVQKASKPSLVMIHVQYEVPYDIVTPINWVLIEGALKIEGY